jgi:hypothetical protein
MFGFTSAEMSASLQNMLDGEALVLYSANMPVGAHYDEKIKMLQDEYSSKEQRIGY